MNNFLKLATINLIEIEPNKVVKVAGLLSKIKTWIKLHINKEFKENADILDKESDAVRTVLFEIFQLSNKIQESLTEHDLLSYRENLKILKEKAKILLEKINNTQTTTEKVVSKIVDKYYSEKDLTPELQKSIEQQLPKNFDIELNKNLSKPLLSFSYYSNLQPQNIVISAKNVEKLKEQISKILPTVELNDNIINNFKLSIINGDLIGAQIKKPNKVVKMIEPGSINLFVRTGLIEIPNTNMAVQGTVILIDHSTGLSGRKVITIEKINKFIIAKQASIKTAKQVDRVLTSLSDTDFAHVLAKGYELAFKQEIPLDLLAFGWAQGVLEAGSPVKLPGNNIGNIKATDPWIKSGKDFFVRSTKELDSKGKEYVEHGTKWRAFATPEEGAASYWQLLKNRFPEVFNLASKPDEAAKYLGKKHYYTANIDKYSSGVKSLYNKFMKNIAPSLGTKQPAKIPQQEEENVENLLEKLVASPLTDRVKTAILAAQIPKSVVNVKIFGDKITGIEFAKIASYHLKQYAKISSSIHVKNNDVELNISDNLPNILIYNVANDFLTRLNAELKNKLGRSVSFVCVPEMSSKLPEITADEILSNNIKFKLGTL